jgi:hypothetical protein
LPFISQRIRRLQRPGTPYSTKDLPSGIFGFVVVGAGIQIAIDILK